MALYDGHFSHARLWLHTLCSLATNPSEVPMAFVLSTEHEEGAWQTQMRAQPCRVRWATTTWWAATVARDGLSNAYFNRHYRYASNLSAMTYKWRAIAVKKLYGLLFFRFERTLVLDAEARVVKPFSPLQLFHDFFQKPSFWYSLKSLSDAKSRSSAYHALMPTTVVLSGMIEPAVAWGNLKDGYSSNSTATLAAVAGVPAGAVFLDVQHWFMEFDWLVALIQRLELLYGSLTEAIFRPRFNAWEVPLLYVHLYQMRYRGPTHSRRHRFYATDTELQTAGLEGYAQRLQHITPGGVGEVLLHGIGAIDEPNPKHSSARNALRRRLGADERTRLQALVDHPEHPIFVFREVPGKPGSSRLNSMWRARVRREFICACKHLFLSVCQQPSEAYYCSLNGSVHLGLPPRRA